jgi:hypothetical protein
VSVLTDENPGEGAAQLRVRGGAGGVSAQLDDLESTGRLLMSAGVELASSGRALAALALDPGAAWGAVRSPVTFARAEAALLAAGLGGHGLVTAAARLELLGGGAVAVARSYRGVDAATARALRSAGRFAGGALGAAAGALTPGLVPVVVGAAGLVAGNALGVGAAGQDGTEGGSGPEGGGGPDGESGPEGQGVGGLDVAGGSLLRLLADHRRPVEAGLPFLVGGLGSAVGSLPGGRLLATTIFRRWDGPSGPADIALGLRVLGRVAGAGAPGLLHDDTPVAVKVASGPTSTVAVRGVADLLSRIPPSAGGAKIHVERLDGPDGRRRWLALVPGTDSWSPVTGASPFDLSGDVGLVSGARSAGMTATARALQAAGARPGEPVLLAGHSQGGLIAAAMAADPATRRELTIAAVVTSGAPVASVPVPGDVPVLALEHDDDLVPGLDAARNHDRANWVTVSTPAPTAGLTVAERSEPLVAHRLELYRRTAEAVDTSTDASIVAWRQEVAAFLDDRAEVAAWDVEVRRPTMPPPTREPWGRVRPAVRP